MRFRNVPRRVRGAGAVCAAAFAGLSGVGGGAAVASPLDDPHVGGLTFSGPTSGNLAAIYWNPAALGLMRGNQVMVAGATHFATTTVTRAAIDPTTGAPLAGGLAPGTATASDMSQPVQWPPGPGSFLGISTDLGGDRFTLAFATYTPYVQQIRFPTNATGDEPTRYHAIEVDLRNLALVPALAIRFGSDFRVGVAPGFMFSTGRLAFAHNTALDTGSTSAAENPGADARFDLDSGHGLGNAKFSVTLGGGIYFRRRALEFGLAYSSRPLGGDVPGVEVAAERNTVTAPGGAAVTCPGGPNGRSERCVFADINYRLPDVWIGGVTLHLRPGLEVTAMVRWLWFHVHDRVDIRLTGPTLAAAGIPEHMVFSRGFNDVWDTRVRVSYWLRERVRLGAGLRFETSAVDATAVNAAAVDGFKVEPMVLAELQLGRRFWISAGYGFTYMGTVTASPSVFDPTLATACAKAGGDVGNPGCQARASGRALPTAQGTYARTVHDLGLSMVARF